jgi:hypothetical protein
MVVVSNLDEKATVETTQLNNNGKLSDFDFRVELLEIMGSVLERLSNNEQIVDSDSLIESIASFAVRELRMDGSIRLKWQSAAARIVTSVLLTLISLVLTLMFDS